MSLKILNAVQVWAKAQIQIAEVDSLSVEH